MCIEGTPLLPHFPFKKKKNKGKIQSSLGSKNYPMKK